jgi:hypothetical protein
MIDPANPSLSLHLAWAYQLLGRTEEARAALRKSDELGLKPEAIDSLESEYIKPLRRQINLEQAPEASPG